jgi:hypothetical protein
MVRVTKVKQVAKPPQRTTGKNPRQTTNQSEIVPQISLSATHSIAVSQNGTIQDDMEIITPENGTNEKNS